MSYLQLCQFSSISSSKSVSEVLKTSFLTFFRVSWSSTLCFKLLILPMGPFSSKSSSKSSQYCLGSPKNPFFDGLSGFLQLGVVLETSNIAHVTPRVHTFLGKKEFFKSVENFFYLDTRTYTHTNIQSPTNTYIVIDYLIGIQ